MSAALDAPGIRLAAAELLALREAAPPAARHRPASRRPGALSARSPGAGLDLREIRAFAEGDDARRIDPAATARTGTPHVRSFHEDRDDTLLLIADFRPAMLWGTGPSLRSVRGARALARQGWRAAARGASLAALVVEASGVTGVPPGNGAAQMSRICHALADRHDHALEAVAGDAGPAEAGPAAAHRGSAVIAVAAPPGTGFGAALARAARIAGPGAEVMIATGGEGIGAADEPALARLARRRRVRILLPLDPIETRPPARALAVHSGGLVRVARLAPLDLAGLARRLAALTVVLEAFDHD